MKVVITESQYKKLFNTLVNELDDRVNNRKHVGPADREKRKNPITGYDIDSDEVGGVLDNPYPHDKYIKPDADAFKGKQNRSRIDTRHVESISEEIPDRYKDKGFSKVGVKKTAPKGSDHKWEVLAKKGDKYKIVKGGDSDMKDYSQHKDEDRKKQFWDRMGGKDSAKANDPFSALYWAKKFGKW